MLMKPGRELDKLVAEVMGWGDFWTDGTTLMGYSPEEYTMGMDAERQLVPEYSTDWRAAGLAWEWLVKKEADHHGWFRLGTDNDIPFVFYFVPHQDPSEVAIAQGETFQHAIALAVVEVAKVSGAGDESD